MDAGKNIQSAWDFIFTKLYHKGAKLIYDYRTTEDDDGAFVHLPTKEEIARNYPNPCGWTSGMEDGDIQGGVMLDAVIYRYEITKEKSLKVLANDLYEGLMRNATLSEERGFLIRNRHPEDGKTHYINSSRDQYTHWVYAMLHFYHSELSNEEQREAIRKVLVEFAKKAKRDIIQENDYCLLNEEGRPSLVGDMRGINVVWHEALRTAMIYMAAYVVTKDEYWLETYRQEREWGLATSEQIKLNPVIYKGAFALMQMQLSVRLCYDYETEPAYKERYENLMAKVAEFSEYYAPISQEALKGVTLPKTVPAWRECPETFIEKKVSKGYPVTVCWVKRSAFSKYYEYRNLGESLITQLLCENRAIDFKQVQIFKSVVESLSLAEPFDAMVTGYCLTWWMLKSKNLV